MEEAKPTQRQTITANIIDCLIFELSNKVDGSRKIGAVGRKKKGGKSLQIPSHMPKAPFRFHKVLETNTYLEGVQILKGTKVPANILS